MRISVSVKTGSGKPGIKKLSEKSFVISVRERPVDGKANKAVIRSLADHFNVAPSRISIIRGQKGKIKIVDIN